MLEKPNAVMIEGEDYQVVDECIGEEGTNNSTENKSPKNSVENTNSKATESVPEDNASETVEQKESIAMGSLNDIPPDAASLNNKNNAVPNAEHLSLSNTNSTDTNVATVLDNIEQIDEQKDMTDEDVLNHLDEIENIVLDPAEFQNYKVISQPSQSNNQVDSCTKENFIQKVEQVDNVNINQAKDSRQETQIKKETAEKEEWYRKKLAEKEGIVKERLSKLARVLGFSYPSYEKWLEQEEKVNGCAVCKLKPIIPCCLDKPFTNRWKFICTRKPVQDPSKIGNFVTSLEKNVPKAWRLEASGAWGVDPNNDAEFPPFVLRAVKIFEEFLESTEQPTSQESVAPTDNYFDDISMEIDTKKETPVEGKQQWSWLLVRCNSMGELMLFATGKNISHCTMERLKEVYESGPGKDCNVKSLYCRSENNCNEATVTNTTFLVGSEALDEVVGGIKVQLAPKTNFWSNPAGAENVANTVTELLQPTPETTVLEIGCGIGLIGLMLASKCQKVIGVDSPSEVEEAELTCDLNNIKNASFIMGSPSEVTNKLAAEIQRNQQTYAVVNANTNIGRALEVMTCLKKLTAIKRIVMVTTLTKQSVRAILELARPVGRTHGHPFIPTLACVVDTLPVGPHFEAVILMERRVINKMNNPCFVKNQKGNVNATESKITGGQIDTASTAKTLESQTKKNVGNVVLKRYPAKKPKVVPTKKPFPVKVAENLNAKDRFKGKRVHSPEKSEAPPKKIIKQVHKFGTKPWHTDSTAKKKKDWVTGKPQLRLNPSYEKNLRDNKEQADLRERLSSNRVDTDIAQKVKEHQALLEIAKEKLSGPAPTVDVTTAKQLQNMLNMVLEQTNKLQSQLPRSVWDRIAPPENANTNQNKDDMLLKGRYIQEMGAQDILITTANKKFVNDDEPKPGYRKYNNLPPLEPNTIMPVGEICSKEGPLKRESPEPQYHDEDMHRQQTQGNSWFRDKMFEKNRWNDVEAKKTGLPQRRQQIPPMKQHVSPSRRFSPKRPLLSLPRRPCSPPRRHFSPLRRPGSPLRQRSPLRHHISPTRRPMSPPRRVVSPPRRTEMPLTRPMSPFRRKMSPIRTTMSPPRRQMSPMRRPMSSPRKQQIFSSTPIMPPSRHEILPNRRETMPQGGQHMSLVRRGGSPHAFPIRRPMSPLRRQQSPPRRQISSSQRFADDWDIPSRGAIEQKTLTQATERMTDTWRTERPSTSNTNWEQNMANDRYRKTLNQDKWATKDCSRGETWASGGNNNWNSKQMSVKPIVKETWSQNPDMRWSDASNAGTSNGDNWNIRGKESFTAREESWIDNKKQNRWESSNVKDSCRLTEKEDWHDLPEDAKDPWGDDGNLDVKERWMKFDNTGSTFTRIRENEQEESWSKQWHPEEQSFGAKSQWQNNGNQRSEESRQWSHHQNDHGKASLSSWPSSSNTGSWQTRNLKYQSDRAFSMSQYKDLR